MAAGAAAGETLLRQMNAAGAGEKKLDVVVVGAGLAGLVVAYELEQRGHSVTILEAERAHVGGRVRTLRFEDGLYGEAGAMRVPKRHAVTRAYAKKFGVELRPFVQSNPMGYTFARGRKERNKDAAKLGELYRLTEPERRMTPDDLWAKAVGSVLGGLSEAEKKDLLADELATEKVRRLDQISLQQLAEQAGLSQEAIEFLMVAWGSETLVQSAATEHLREELEEVWAPGFDEVAGGTDRLPAAFLAQLKNKPRMGCEVVRITQDRDKRRAAAVYREGGEEKRVEGDYVVCTIPLPVLSKIEADLPGETWRAIRQLSYDSSTKVLAVCERRFWEIDDGIYGGGTYTDLPTGTTYYPADNAAAKDAEVSKRPGVMLASYSWGHQARRLGMLEQEVDRRRVVETHLSKVHPQFSKELRRTTSWAWDSYKWAGGAFAWFSPGQHVALHAHLVKPAGRILLAGEHASLAHTWMQGALESGLRVVKHMLEA